MKGTGSKRAVVAAGSLVGCAALLTAAAFTDFADVDVTLDGSQNRFDIVTTGSSTPGWMPTATEWVQGKPEAYQIKLTSDGSGYVLSPGARLDLRVAARNASPRLGAELSLKILDPDAHGDATDPVTGRYVDLWNQLVFTVREGSTVLFDHVKATDLAAYVWQQPTAAGTERVLDVTIQLPSSVDNRWQLASTDIRFDFEAVNS